MNTARKGIVRRFLDLNTALSDAVERRLPRAFKRSLLYMHELKTAEIMNAIPDCRVLDVGGGHLSPFARHRKNVGDAFIIGADILPEQVLGNEMIDVGLVCDACNGLPFKSASVDLVVTRSVIEHLPDVSAFLRECRRVLKPGGTLVSVHPCKRAPFALLNRVVPNWIVRRGMATFHQAWADECGFVAHYDKCGYPEMPEAIAAAGLDVIDLEVRYYQSIYFKPFFPIFFISLLYDLMVWKLGIRYLCCQMLSVARKRPEEV